MLPVIQIGPFALQAPGLILLLGVWIGLYFTERYAYRLQQKIPILNPNVVYQLAMLVFALGVIGARLSYLIQYPSAFANSPLSLISLNPGLLDPWGGFAAALIAGLVYLNRKQLPLLPILDVYTPALAIFALAFHLANLASGEAFGAPADLPWAVELWGARRHPTQVYESLTAALILWFIWPLRDRRPFAPHGWLFLTFMGLSAGARLFLEAFRGDSSLLPGGLRTAQVIAWFVLTGCLIGLMKLKSISTHPPAPYEQEQRPPLSSIGHNGDYISREE